MAAFLGQTMNLYLKDASSTGDYLLVGCAVSSEYNETHEEIEARCKGSGDWAEKQPGTGSWSVSTDGFVIFSNEVNPQVIHDWSKNKTLLDVKITTDVPGDSELTGEGYIMDLTVTAATDEITSYSFTIMGTGEPTWAVII